MLLACAQYAVRDGDLGSNRERSLHAIRDAADAGVDLVVLPELANSGCDFPSEQAMSLAEAIPDSPTIQAWSEVAAERSISVAGGILERDGQVLHNTAVIVGPDGLIGRYRKAHLWSAEKLLYEPGSDLPVFETPLCRIGLLVCYDAWFPEAARTLALRGADLLCVPANAPDDWVPEEQRHGGLTMLDVHAISHANANRIFVACANRVGDGYLGRSCIVDPKGGVLALGSPAGEEPLLADIDPTRARREKHLTENSHAFGDRNIGVYEVAGQPISSSEVSKEMKG